MKKVMPLVLTALITLSTIAPISSTKTSAAELTAVNVSVEWDNTKSSTSEFSFGINGFNALDPQVATNPEYQKNMEYMNFGVIRYHSWEMIRESKRPDGTDEPNGWIKTVDGVPSWDKDKVKQALEAMGSRAGHIMINIPWFDNAWGWGDSDGYLKEEHVDDYVNFCAELVKIVNVDFKLNVKYWEPINERDDLYYVHLRNENKADRLDEMIDIYNQCAKAMKAVDPSIHTGGPAFARPDLLDQVRRFVDGTVNEGTLDFFSYHFYGSGDLGESDTKIYNRSIDLANNSAKIREIVDTKSPDRHIPLWCNEYNVSWSWTNNDPRMHNHKGGVFDALCMVAAHNSGVDVTNAWNEYDGVYGKINSRMQLQPNAHIYQLFNNYLVGDVVKTSSSDESKIVSFAVKNPTTGAKAYLIINRTDNVQVVKTNFRGLSTNREAIQQHQLSEIGYHISENNWYDIGGKDFVVPANSVTVLTDSSVKPTIIPAPVTALTNAPIAQTINIKQSEMGSGINKFDFFGDWGHGGVDSWTDRPGNYFQIKFWGTQIKLYTKKDDWSGIAAVSIDGGEEEFVDTFGSWSHNNLVYTSPVLPQGEHILKVTVTDRKNEASKGLWICPNSVDVLTDGTPMPGYTSLLVNDNEIGDNPNQFIFGENWGYWTPEGGNYKEDLHYSNTKDAFYQIKFYGTQIKWSTKAAPDGGIAAISIDGGEESLIDTYSEETRHQSTLFTSEILPIGFHTLKVRVTDMKNDNSQDYYVIGDMVEIISDGSSIPPMPTEPESAGVLRGAVANSSAADLELAGTLDWAKWGDNANNPLDAIRKSGNTHQISDIALIGSPSNVESRADGEALSWTNGAPVATGNGITSALAAHGPQNTGFKFTVPADTNARTLKVYVGVYGTKAILKATLSDGSAAPYITSYEDSNPTVINNSSGTARKVVTLTYKAASPGQTLTIEYFMNYNHWGNTMWLQGAALSEADIVAPTAPTQLRLIGQTATTAAFSWEASNDNVGVIAYDIYYDKKLVGTTTAPTNSYFIQGLIPDKDYEFVVKARDAAGNESEPSSIISISGDRVAPLIELVGAATLNIAGGEAYVEAGVTITDNKDTGLTAIVTYTKDGTTVDAIDTTIAGTYIIYYNVSDTAGNNAVEVTRTVTVANAVNPDTGTGTGGSGPIGETNSGLPLVNVVNTNVNSVLNAINSIASNGKVVVDVTSNKSVAKEVFEAIKGTDKTVTFTQNGVEWSFNGKDITGSTKAVDMTVNVAALSATNSGNKAAITEKVNNENVLVISFAKNGQLPGKAKVRVKLDAAWLAGKNKNNINIYYYNETTKAIETIASALVVDSEGYVQFDITHNSDYIVSDQDLTKTTIPTTPTTPTPEQPKPAAVVRLGGANRYETSVKVSQAGWTNADNVVLARGDEFADALTAAPFAKQLNAPILLTSTKALDASVIGELKRLKTKKVYIIGGTGAIAASVENAVKAMGITVERISGSDRYATSLAIATKMTNKSQVFLATGTGFADALSISSYAAATGSPILLTAKDQMTAGVAKFIKDNNSKVYVIGGTGVISEAAVKGIAGAERIAGADRYATNLAVLNKFAAGYDFTNIYLATGANYPDAICGSALAGRDKAPIILVGKDLSEAQKVYLKSIENKVKQNNLLGGEAVIPKRTVEKAFN